ncbi:hypothetical protein EVAR_74778_1 [Eumeta japonica]|uniref:Uncharacterized protein n=1 Tax=Eumeta variegata TaxID=151549 RepID=A0A4C1SQ07_EUMVA|nr:hypothetical protein EVAR_74778_1 [Eumeta japonica]
MNSTTDYDAQAETLRAKIVTMVCLFGISMIVGCIPIIVSKKYDWFTKTSGPNMRSSNLLVMGLLAFGGGVLFATTFMHLLPEVDENIHILQGNVPTCRLCKLNDNAGIPGPHRTRGPGLCHERPSGKKTELVQWFSRKSLSKDRPSQFQAFDVVAKDIVQIYNEIVDNVPENLCKDLIVINDFKSPTQLSSRVAPSERRKTNTGITSKDTT